MELINAEKIAYSVLQRLEPFCNTIHIAGSIRRRKPEVKDIEITCIPMLKIRRDLFGGEQEDGRLKQFIETVQYLGTIIKGSPKDGRYVQIKLHEGINLDLFIPQPDDYYRLFAIRTGSSDYSKTTIALAWKSQGWCGTKEGLRRIQECIKNSTGWKCINKDAERPPVWQSEEEFFDWLGIKWIEPNLRNI